ncbi:hypothetical protein L6164_006233 [Bauhinia variegata]|uniref:Uncharacterized protein n=1 Tax=Bauhinia variegata TaxID=167791 RepID=A0ACB9PVM2_BAUVA|nr:hypothetical protein L6164_006233 [Bauhinia variegata]
MNPMVVLRVALMLFLVGAIAKIEARLDPEAIAEAGMDLDLMISATRPFNAYTIFDSKPSNKEACCDACPCTKSYPPQCRCLDVTKNRCHGACQKCMCTRSLPGKCRCLDITDSCLPQCSGVASKFTSN